MGGGAPTGQGDGLNLDEQVLRRAKKDRAGRRLGPELSGVQKDAGLPKKPRRPQKQGMHKRDI